MTIAIMRSGARIDLAAPRADQILVRDIAEPLSKQPMYDGRAWNFYSKAQHSLIVAAEAARTAGPLPAFYALLRLAPDAFGAPGNGKLLRKIWLAFGLPGIDKRSWDAIECARASAELSEHRQLLTNVDAEVAVMEARGVKPLKSAIKPLAWDRAMDRYIDALRVNAIAAQLPRLPVWGNIL